MDGERLAAGPGLSRPLTRAARGTILSRMAKNTVDRAEAVAAGVACGVSEATAGAVADAYAHLSQRCGRSFDPRTWSRTVWLAEADRCQRSKSPEQLYAMLLHLQDLREGFEEKVRRGARAWSPGEVGERLTKR